MKKGIESTLEKRILLVLFSFLIAFGLLLGRLFMLQVVFHKDYVEAAAKQHRFVDDIALERGSIFAQDKNGEKIPLAINRAQKTLVASPRNIKDPEGAADVVSEAMGIAKEDLISKFSLKDDAYEVIAKKIDQKTASSLEGRLPTGVFLQEDNRRVYPNGQLAANLLGFVSINKDVESGKYGLERYYEDDLAGKRGFFEGAKDTYSFWAALGRRIINPVANGSDILLTVDYNIQKKAEEILSGVYKKWGASSGLIMVMDPKTGKILAEASTPTFDPNDFGKIKDYSVFINPLEESMYEFGSVMKPVTMAAGLEEGVVTPNTTYTDTGEVKIKGYTVKNFDLQGHGVQTMTQVLEKSLNTGVVFVSHLLGQDRQLEYIKKFGFGEKTGIDLPGEVQGNISNLLHGREIDFATAAFGQGIAVTPIQLASAIGAVANGGVLLRPYVVDSVTDDSGNVVRNSPQEKSRVISKETSEALTKMLISAVRNGFENRAGLKGYFVAGKTGTAQIPKRDGKGYSDNVIHSFVGYAPAFDPRFLVLIQLNEPKGNRFAANTLTPAFHDLAEYIVNYYEIPPDESR